jgi:phage baseplate assembly protein W
MAQRIANRFPVDLQTGTALGVSLPFSGGGDAVFGSNFTTQNQIKSNIINWALTNRGERPFRPNYGANLRANIFEALNEGTFDILEEKLKLGMSTNFPNVIIRNMQVQQNEQEYSIGIIITYSIAPFGINDTINLTFNN